VVATVTLFAIITWFRDDDWLAAGFLFTLTAYLGGVVADLIVSMVARCWSGGAIDRRMALLGDSIAVHRSAAAMA
jgi:hypothetical protein